MQKRQEAIVNGATGHPVQGATVTVTTLLGVAATIYTADGSGLISGNTVTTDSNGRYYYYAADGRYTETITGSGITSTVISDILLEDPVDGLAALSASGGSALVGFLPSGTGAITTETVQAALRRMVFSGQYGSAANFNTAQSSLTDKAGFKELRVGTGAGDGIVWPSQGTAPFQTSVGGSLFNGVFDPQLNVAYNYASGVAGEHSFGFVLEGHYYDGADHWMELNLDYANASAVGKRFLAFQVNRTTDASAWAIIGDSIRLESVANQSGFVFAPLTGKLTRSIADGAVATAATVKTGLQLNNSTGGAGTLSAAIAFDVGGGGGVAKIYTERLGGSGGVLHFATDTTGGTITDRWKINEAGNLINMSTGQIHAYAGANTAPGYAFATQPTVGFFLRTASSVDLSFGSSDSGFTFQTTALTLRSTSVIAWSSTTDAAAAPDLVIVRDAANVFAQKNGTTAQEFRVYGTTTGPKYFSLKHDGTNALAVPQAGQLAFQTAALATNATTGYMTIPSCAGTPTGVPASIPTGQIPMVYDSTNHFLYVYEGAAWKKSTVYA